MQLDIPADLAYGEAGQPPAIPPNAALTFVMDIVDVIDVPEVELPEEQPTELQRTVITEGPSDGPEVEDFDTVNVYARGVLSADGTEIENNFGDARRRRRRDRAEQPGRRGRRRPRRRV